MRARPLSGSHLCSTCSSSDINVKVLDSFWENSVVECLLTKKGSHQVAKAEGGAGECEGQETTGDQAYEDGAAFQEEELGLRKHCRWIHQWAGLRPNCWIFSVIPVGQCQRQTLTLPWEKLQLSLRISCQIHGFCHSSFCVWASAVARLKRQAHFKVASACMANGRRACCVAKRWCGTFSFGSPDLQFGLQLSLTPLAWHVIDATCMTRSVTDMRVADFTCFDLRLAHCCWSCSNADQGLKRMSWAIVLLGWFAEWQQWRHHECHWHTVLCPYHFLASLFLWNRQVCSQII